MKKALKWFDENFEITIMAVLLAALTIVMLAELTLRFLRIGSVKWGTEFCQYCFVYSTFFAIPYCIRSNTNLKIDVLINKFPIALKKMFEILESLLCLGLWAFFFYHAIGVLKQSLANVQYSTTMGFSMAWIFGIPAVTFAMAIIREIQHLIKVIITKPQKALTKEEEAAIINAEAEKESKGGEE